jgi:acyl-CoA synthetase (AMP-forming)/AMP-acid ligase II
MSHSHLTAWILETLSHRSEAATFSFHGRSSEEAVTAGRMARRIAGAAAGLRAAGLPARAVVPVVGTTSAGLWSAFVGAMAADLIPSIMPSPTHKTHVPTYVRNLTALMARYRSQALLCADEFSALLAPVLGEASPGTRLLSLEGLPAEADTDAVAPSSQAADVAFLQHSSGSTGVPKGVALSHAAVVGHLQRYAEAIGLDPARDRICSWLPLYHDMGLITSFLLPLAFAVSCDSIPPQEWIVDPASVLDRMTRSRSTLAWWPNFTYSLLAKRAPGADLDRYDLRSVRMLVNCSEPVMAGSHEAFRQTFAACGLPPSALQASYAMAENVFAVTQSRGDGPRLLHVEPQSLREGCTVALAGAGDPRARAVVSSGPVMCGVSALVVDGDRRPQPDGYVGEIAISGASLFGGYYLMPEATAPVLVDGWYYTGDVGFRLEGELFVLGRKSDLIIVGGRKFYPNDIEHVVSEIEGVKEGRVVAFGVTSEDKGTEEVVVLAESAHHDERARAQQIKKEIKARVLQRVDCVVERAVLLPPNSLIKTSSGKIARRDNRQWHLEGRFGAR